MHGAFTERFSLFRLGARSLETMTDFGILTHFTGIVVTDRYCNYFHTATWKNISGHQACVQHPPCKTARKPSRNDLARPGARRAPQADPRPQPGRHQGLDAVPCRHPRTPLQSGTVPPRHHRRTRRRFPASPAPRNSTKQHPGRDMRALRTATVKPTS